MKKPSVSIVVPVFKALSTLEKCIQSVICQQNRDWELILVDDGSPDSSGAICDRYSLSDDRIKTIHKSNGGVSSARNLGLDNASGYWITFLDSDDWLEPSALDVINEISSASDLILFGYNRISAKSCSKMCFESKTIKRDTYKSDLANIMMSEILLAPWSKFFKADIIRNNGIRFDESIHWAEDRLFNLEFVSHTDEIRMSDTIAYNYLVPDSNVGLMKYRISMDMLLTLFNKLHSIVDEMQLPSLAPVYTIIWKQVEKVSCLKSEDSDYKRKEFYKRLTIKDILTLSKKDIPVVLVCKYLPEYISSTVSKMYLHI